MCRILIIGNSFTFGNNMPDMLLKILEGAGLQNVKVDSVTKGGHTLLQHCDPEDEQGKQVNAILANNKYDFVIIQEQSSRPAVDFDLFLEGVRILVKKVRANGAKPVLYETWGYKTGHKMLAERGWTTQSMARELALAYEKAGKETDSFVVYCGLAMLDAFENHADFSVYEKDLKHPGKGGSYLVALSFAYELYGIDPESVLYVPEGLSGEEAGFFRKTVKDFFAKYSNRLVQLH